MKLTKLSLIAALAVSSMTTTAVAGDTTVTGKAQAYYLTTDDSGTGDLGSNGTSKTGTAITLDVAHKLTDAITANFSAVGYTHLGNEMGANKFEGSPADGFFNVANLTGSFGDTTVVVGRQLLSTPTITGFDWLLAPGSFEAATLTNNSVDKFTFSATYITRFRQNDTGDNFIKLADNNYGLGIGYDDVVNANLWYYNVDDQNYKQTYLDIAKTFGTVTVAAQGVQTNYATATDATAYGAKVSGEILGIGASLAYNKLNDNATGYIGVDSLYTSSWNTFTSRAGATQDANVYKVELSKEFGNLSATASFADYDNNAEETDIILGYALKDNVSFGVIYSNTTDIGATEANQALELTAIYGF